MAEELFSKYVVGSRLVIIQGILHDNLRRFVPCDEGILLNTRNYALDMVSVLGLCELRLIEVSRLTVWLKNLDLIQLRTYTC